MTAQQEVFQALESLCNYAYEHGFHEFGYDPINVVRGEIERLTKELCGLRILYEAGNRVACREHEFISDLKAEHYTSMESGVLTLTGAGVFALDQAINVMRERDRLRTALERIANHYGDSYMAGSVERALGDAAREALRK